MWRTRAEHVGGASRQLFESTCASLLHPFGMIELVSKRQRNPGKRYSVSARREREGIALIDQIVTSMGHIWREKGVDHGIDGEIELVDEDGNATNRVLWVQSKAQGDSNPFPGETDNGFHWRASADDLQYWSTGTAPVLLVCSHPQSGEAWFRDLSEWFKDPRNRAERNIPFDKVRDQFGSDAGRRLLHLGADARSGLYLRPVPRRETVTTNLLAIKHIAPTVTIVRSSCRGWADANARLVKAGVPTVSDLVFSAGEVFSLRATGDPVILAIADGPVRSIATEDFTHDSSSGPLMPWLLNGTLKDMTHRDLRFDADRKYLYFKANRDGSDRKANSGPKRSRTVVVRKRPPEDANWSEYFRHYALEHRFHLLDEHWFMSVVPTYHFTSDGSNDSPFAATLLKGIKQREGHSAIRGQTSFWAHFLSWAPTLFTSSPDARLQFGRLETVDVDRGIDDRSWKPAPPEFTNADVDIAPTLFDQEDP